MPLPIQDARLQSALATLQARAAADPAFTAGDAELLTLLAPIADRSGLSASAMLTKLQGAKSAREIADLVGPGMTASEKADLKTVLQASGVKLSPSARATLEEVLRRDAFSSTGGTQGTQVTTNLPPTSVTAAGDWFAGPDGLKDTGVRAAFSALETRHRSDPAFVADVADLLSLLASVADSSKLSGAKAKAALQAPGADQLALVLSGMSASEKRDLSAILDRGDVPLTAAAKALLFKAVGRPVPPQSAADFLTSNADKATTVSQGGHVLQVSSDGKSVSIDGSPAVLVAADGSFTARLQLPGFGGPVPVLGQVKNDGSVELKVPSASQAAQSLERVFFRNTTAVRSPAMDAALGRMVGLSASGVVTSSNGARGVEARLVSKDLVRVRVGDAEATMRINADGSFGSREPLGAPIAGRFDESGRFELLAPAVKLGFASPQPTNVTDTDRAFALALAKQAGLTATVPLNPVGSFVLELGFRPFVRFPGGSVPVVVAPDGSFSATSKGSVISGRFRADGKVLVTQASGPGMSAANLPQLIGAQGTALAASLPSERELALWQAQGRPLVNTTSLNEGYPRVVPTDPSHLSITFLMPNNGAALSTATVEVAKDGSFFANTSSGPVTGIVSSDGHVTVNVPGLPSQSLRFPPHTGPFDWTWREEDLVGGTETNNGWVELVAGSANRAARRAAFTLELAAAFPLADVLPPLAALRAYQMGGAWTDADQAAFETAIDAFMRRTDLTPAQNQLRDQLRAVRSEVATHLQGLAGGMMRSEDLTWLESKSAYVRGRPIADHDVAGRQALDAVLTGKIAHSATASFATVQVLPGREVLVKFAGEERKLPVHPDGTFGLIALNGQVLTGFLGTDGGVVLSAGRQREVVSLRPGAALPVFQPPDVIPPYTPPIDLRAPLDAKTGYVASAAQPPLSVRLNGRDSLTVMLRGESMTARIEPNGLFTGIGPKEYVTGSIDFVTGQITFRGTPDLAKLPKLQLVEP